MERTKKQWHRYFIEEISNIISKHVDKDNDVFVECGVKQGSSSVRMGQRLGINGYLFDTWSGFPNFSDLDVYHDKDRRQMENRIKKSSDTYNDCLTALKKKGVFNLCTLVRGDILETIPDFMDCWTVRPIAMMHIDTDLYEPAKISLESFWPHVKESGVVYFHDYGDKKWRGIKKVVDDLVSIDNDLYFHQFDNNKLFSACIVKGKNKISENIFNSIVSLDK
jgi:hypothetical protein